MSERRLPDAQQFARSRGISLFLFIASAGVLAYSVYFVFIVGFDQASIEHRHGLLIYGCCVIVLPVFVVAAAIFARAALKRENGLIIDEEGVHDQLSFNGKIDWSNIVGVQRLNPNSDSSAFVLQLRDRRSYLRHGWTKPFVARGENEIMIYGLGLSPAAEILAAIGAGIHTANFSGKNV